MKVLVVRPDENPVVEEISGTLEEMQNIVGGWIQHIMPWADDVAIVCNEEGKMINLPLNRFVITDEGKLIDYIAGTFFICYAPPEAESFQGLPDELIEKYSKRFQFKGDKK